MAKTRRGGTKSETPPPQKVDLEQLFHMIDSDGSGTVEAADGRVSGFGVEGFLGLGSGPMGS